MRRKRPDPKRFDLTHTCPVCGYKIPPSEIMHTDGEHIRCPKCGQESVYGPSAKAQASCQARAGLSGGRTGSPDNCHGEQFAQFIH
jgi:predicted RNA-binding Zn-ribbon protein involved in translation (DUF1610 family)